MFVPAIKRNTKTNIMKTLNIETLKKLNNKNYKWFTHMGVKQIVNVTTDNAVIHVDEKRIYFFNELDFLATSDLYETTDEAMIVASAILNSYY
jgi:hypothetical protein